MIKIMNDLPDPALPGIANNPKNNNPGAGPSGPGIISKETEAGVFFGETPTINEVGQDIELPKEVSSAGVKVRPTTVTIPAQVAKMGAKTVGSSVPAAATTVVLPLTDDQIVQGLHRNVASSLRWLAEWCLRRLKQLHLAIKSIHGKLVRVKQ